MTDILDFPTTFKGIKEPQDSSEHVETLTLYPTVDTMDFEDGDDIDMRECTIETPHVDILVIHDVEENDYYIKAGHMLSYAETKKEANDLIRDIIRSLNKI